MKHMEHAEVVRHIEHVYESPKESSEGFFGAIVSIASEIGLFVFAVVLLALFVFGLIAPLFGNVITASLHEKKWNTPNITVAQISRIDAQIRATRIGLWIIAVISWSLLFAANINHF